MLEVRSGTKFRLLPLFNTIGPFLGLTRNLGVCQIKSCFLKHVNWALHSYKNPSSFLRSGVGIQVFQQHQIDESKYNLHPIMLSIAKIKIFHCMGEYIT